MKKQIEFIVDEGKKPLDVVRLLRDLLNVRYHHHYFQYGKYILEYYDKD